MEEHLFQERQYASGDSRVIMDGSFVWIKRVESGNASFGQLKLAEAEPDLEVPILGLVPTVSESFQLLAMAELSPEEAAQLRISCAKNVIEKTGALREQAVVSGARLKALLGPEESEKRLMQGLDSTVSQMKRIIRQPLAEWEPGEPLGFAVYSTDEQYLFTWGSMQQVLRKLFRFRGVYRKVRLNSRELAFESKICGANPYGLDVKRCCLQVGELLHEVEMVPMADKLPTIPQLRAGRMYSRTLAVPMSKILAEPDEGDTRVKLEGNACSLMFEINGYEVRFPMRMPVNVRRVHFWERKRSVREVWLPIASAYVGDYAFHVRRSVARTFIFFKRKVDPLEQTSWYRFIESVPVSFLLFHLGRILNRFPVGKKNALFFEKFSSKAEEGTFELCQMCSTSKKTNCWYIIDEHSPDYQRIKNDPCTVRKFSLKYYWLIYNANFFIAAEAPIHLTIFNSHNYYLRWSLLRHPFVFLQHGITYMKRQGLTSTFLKGRAGEAKFIVASSDKERSVVARDFQIARENVWVTGMLMFDHCEYGHINQQSPDKVTVMLTWKPYEASMGDFEQSSYYKNTVEVCNLLTRYVDRSQINIVAHPHAYAGLKKTPLGNQIWDKPISEVLRESKLLITDYSSVCWNSFYQGGGVIFFQPDLEEYEASVGRLIPRENEYIGYRVYDMAGLEEQLQKGVRDGQVDLSYYRNEEFERVYQTINQFHDGKNTERIYRKLKENGFV